ncbi:MAG UNVERIFIED_CONTAM: hypothetical protein LVQ98_04580 [Rickettsiaceae bacterium]|jgi:mannose-1-phosphate guanylyltransferase/mannose-6-phosphate isomerase
MAKVSYVSSVQEALNISTSQNIVTFGVKPFKAYSGYGYLKAGQALSSTIFTIEKFIEKPPLEIATEYLASGNYYWNSGIFVFKPEYIMYLASVMEPKMYSLSLKAFYQMKQEENCLILDADAYKQIKGNSIDYAFIEKSENIKMLKVNFSWQDVGSWSSMWEISEKDINNNVIKGPSYGYNNFGSYIYSEQTPATVIGVKDLIIVNTPRGLLVMHKSKSDKLKIILDDIRSKIGLDYTKSQD